MWYCDEGGDGEWAIITCLGVPESFDQRIELGDAILEFFVARLAQFNDMVHKKLGRLGFSTSRLAANDRHTTRDGER
jgi:hypothetical protein